MKKLFLTLFALMMATASLWAEDFSVDGIYYNITDETNKTVAVTSGDSEYLGSVTIPSSVTYDDITYSVTSIDYYAFCGCTGLTSVTIPSSVTSIGNYAFRGCTGLTSVTIPESVTWIGVGAFSGCTGLTSVTIPESVTSIGAGAFSDCTGLTSVTIPNSVTKIGNSAFSYCTGLTSIEVDSNNLIYSSMDGVLYDKDKTTLIAYPGGKQGSFTIPNSVTSIGENAFYICTGLTSVTIPNSVTSIGENAFYICTGLTSVTIPNSVTEIDYSAFSGCIGLTSVTIPNSVTKIGSYAFSDCIGLTSVTIPNSVTKIGSYAFYNTPWYNNQPDGVIYMGKVLYAYKGTMPENTSIEIKEGTVSISPFAFFYCTGLTSITIGNSVTEIGNYAFYNCTGLTSVTIPNSVTEIGFYAFSYCDGLKSIYVYNPTPPTANNDTFDSATFSDATLYIPTGSLSAYQEADVWKEFLNIVEMDFSGVEDVLAEDVNLTIQNRAIVVNGVDEPIYIEVYNLQGQRVYCGYETTIPVNERGIYLVRIANRVVKVVL